MGETGKFLDETIKIQLVVVFEQFEEPVLVRGYYDSSDLSLEMDSFMKEMAQLTNKIIYEKADMEKVDVSEIELPALALCKSNGEDAGILFHGVPGGHEFNSFIVALYNVAGPGKEIDESLKQKILSLPAHEIKIIAALSCTMCPETVQAAQKMAALSKRITAHMFDVAHFPNYREKYKITSVPCIIIDNNQVLFGKHSLERLLDAIN